MINAYIILVGKRHFKDMTVDGRKLIERIWIDFYLPQNRDY